MNSTFNTCPGFDATYWTLGKRWTSASKAISIQGRQKLDRTSIWWKTSAIARPLVHLDAIDGVDGSTGPVDRPGSETGIGCEALNERVTR
jgi:hypothetical protein